MFWLKNPAPNLLSQMRGGQLLPIWPHIDGGETAAAAKYFVENEREHSGDV